ncbi:MAG: hypothetical protein EBX41_01705 [Chitinophagia bacterium]|nr:hypothetical protein [Chitinophagia bacterium]
MKAIFSTVVFLCSLLLLNSCRRPDDAQKVGKGGSNTLVVNPMHHQNAKKLINMKVYIKYGSMDAPAGNVYDDSADCINRDSMVFCSFGGLYSGNYYLYARGYDTSILQNVKGGIPCALPDQPNPFSVMVPVSEN